MLSGPFTYDITFKPESITGVEGPDGVTYFSGPASRPVPKLYVVSHKQRPIYVGVTKQRLGDRMRQGLQSDGDHGYYGYAWRHLKRATVDIWLLEGNDPDKATVEEVKPEEDYPGKITIETVEAEVVFLIRQKYGAWPQYQTEIHFHPSESTHRNAAQDVIRHYRNTYVFEVDIEQEEDGHWGAVINALPGCYAIGFTKEETLEALQDNAQAFLEVITECGDPMPWEQENFDIEVVTITL